MFCSTLLLHHMPTSAYIFYHHVWSLFSVPRSQLFSTYMNNLSSTRNLFIPHNPIWICCQTWTSKLSRFICQYCIRQLFFAPVNHKKNSKHWHRTAMNLEIQWNWNLFLRNQCKWTYFKALIFLYSDTWPINIPYKILVPSSNWIGFQYSSITVGQKKK